MMLEALGVHYCYSPGQSSLQAASIRLTAGELLCLIGPNGAGKTTLVRILSGVLWPQAGQVRLEGQTVHGSTNLKRKVLVMPQALPSSLWALSVREMLETSAVLRELSVKEARLASERAIELLGLDSLLKKRLYQLSGGQARAAFLAAASLGKGPFFILDEPTVGLDPLLREQVWTYLGELRNQGWGLLITSHHLDELESVARRVAFLRAGTIIWDGEVAELWQTLGGHVVLETEPLEKPPHHWQNLPSRIGERSRYLVPRLELPSVLQGFEQTGIKYYRISTLNLTEGYRYLMEMDSEKTVGAR